jgi:hypothetical protein
LLGTPGAYPRRKHLKAAPVGFALALPSNSKTRLERVSKDKPSSYLGLIISDKEKSFLMLTPEDAHDDVYLVLWFKGNATKPMYRYEIIFFII